MESTSQKTSFKNSGKSVSLSLNCLQKGMTLPFRCSLLLITFPSEAPALPPQEKTYLSLMLQAKHDKIELSSKLPIEFQ